jgi:Ca2+-transporting ATPase
MTGRLQLKRALLSGATRFDRNPAVTPDHHGAPHATVRSDCPGLGAVAELVLALRRKRSRGRRVSWQTDAVVVVHDTVPSRLRLRIAGFRDRPARARSVAAELVGAQGIRAAEARPLTGSLILHVDPLAPRTVILEQVRQALGRRRQSSSTIERSPTTAVAPAPRATETVWHQLSVVEATARLGTNSERGLATDEVARRRRRWGPNVLPAESPPSSLALLLNQFRGLPIMLLAGSAFVSLATGGIADAVATLSIVVVNGVLGFVTEGQAERTIRTLIDTAGQNVRVVRDGIERSVPAHDLVPGDLLLVRGGTQIAADARLVAAENLMINEAALTGESMPVAKCAKAELEPVTALGERTTMLYAGTIVAEGTGMAVVVATGPATEAARIQLLSVTTTRPRAPVEVELARLGTRLTFVSLGACGLLIVLGLARGSRLPMLLKSGLALAVAAVPEGLPMVGTTTMALGLRKLEKRGILIRQMSVVESLGAVQTICLDKTGTLTENRMQVLEVVAGTRPTRLDDREALRPIAEVAGLNNDAVLENGRACASSQTEQALLSFALEAGVDILDLRQQRPRLATVERTASRPWMATLHGLEGHDGPRHRLTIKGTPEAILDRCAGVLEDGIERPLTPADRDRILAENDRIASRPARVLAFAAGDPVGAATDPDGLVFLGLVGMVDPIRQGARTLIQQLHGAGIATVMITGDQAATAAATARELGLANGAPLRIVDSTRLADMSQALLTGLAQQAHVFARVASHEKLAIIRALQSAGRVVAMTGDGVNDGPALLAADVGIAMGEAGTDLARDVANVVIRDDELATLIEAIAEGRTIYRNIRRSLEFLVTTNMSEIIVSVVEALHGPGELESPMELLWINLVSDVLPGIGLALAEPERDVMAAAPRPRDEAIIPMRDAQRMLRDGGILAAAALLSHFIGLARHGPGAATRGMTFLTLSQVQLLYTLICQRGDPAKTQLETIFKNRSLDGALVGASLLGLLPFFVPSLRRLLKIARLGPLDTAIALAATALPLATVTAHRSKLRNRELESAR